MASTHREREDKFDVPTGFVLDLGPARPDGESVEDGGVVQLESTYFDTAEHALLDQRLTLRRRRGDTDTGWHLKVPHGAARLEVRLPLEAGTDTVPVQLTDLVAGVTLGEPLATVAVLRVERHVVLVRRGDTVLAEVADDRVRAAATGDAARLQDWREVEVELVDGGEDVLERIGAELRAAGATPAAWSSKLVRALEHEMPGPPEPDDAAGLVRAYLRAQAAALIAGDVSLRRGLDPVHKTRVAARRIRSVLRVFRSALDVEAADKLDRELSWYQDLLGEVRDRQVQRARFAELVGALPPELVLGPVAAELEATLLGEQARALDDVRAALTSERYRRMMRDVRDWATDPPLHPDVDTKTLRRLARKARRKAGKRLDAVDIGDATALHPVRKATKRSRYAAELLRPATGKAAGKRVKRHKRLQDALGAHQDSVLAAEYLRRLGAGSGSGADRNGFTYGLLYGHEQRTRQALVERLAELQL